MIDCNMAATTYLFQNQCAAGGDSSEMLITNQVSHIVGLLRCFFVLRITISYTILLLQLLSVVWTEVQTKAVSGSCQ